MNSEESLRIYKLDEKQRLINSKVIVVDQNNRVLNADEIDGVDYLELKPVEGPSKDTYNIGDKVEVIPVSKNGGDHFSYVFSNEVEISDYKEIPYSEYLGVEANDKNSQKELDNFKRVLRGMNTFGSKSHLEERLMYEDFDTLRFRDLEQDRNSKAKLSLTKKLSEYLVNTITNSIPDSIVNKLLEHYDNLDKKARDDQKNNKLFYSFS